MAALMSVSTTSPLLADLAREPDGEVAGAAGNVQRPLALPEPGQRQRELLPEPVHSAGHQVVHQVIFAGDGVEHAAHAARLFLARPAQNRSPWIDRLAWKKGASVDTF